MQDMTFDRMVQQMTPAIYESLKQAVALRKWPDGRFLTAEQTELCLEAVIKYEIENGVPEEQRVGYLSRRSCGAKAAPANENAAALGRNVGGD
ncbi:YeaC family protein [Pistricoccus aurantiacus]|uniref:YeaC family protein n=1 Tax=Pistricoccus aurantiacus TaxID=1883414 RepID=UPI00362FED0F